MATPKLRCRIPSWSGVRSRKSQIGREQTLFRKTAHGLMRPAANRCGDRAREEIAAAAGSGRGPLVMIQQQRRAQGFATAMV